MKTATGGDYAQEILDDRLPPLDSETTPTQVQEAWKRLKELPLVTRVAYLRTMQLATIQDMHSDIEVLAATIQNAEKDLAQASAFSTSTNLLR